MSDFSEIFSVTISHDSGSSRTVTATTGKTVGWVLSTFTHDTPTKVEVRLNGLVVEDMETPVSDGDEISISPKKLSSGGC